MDQTQTCVRREPRPGLHPIGWEESYPGQLGLSLYGAGEGGRSVERSIKGTVKAVEVHGVARLTGYIFRLAQFRSKDILCNLDLGEGCDGLDMLAKRADR